MNDVIPPAPDQAIAPISLAYKAQNRFWSRGDHFGRYEVQAELGGGSMGRVYQARDPLAQRLVAIKTLRYEYLQTETAEPCRQRFRRECQAAGRLAHPNIVQIFDQGEDFFVMELLEGQLLSARLQEQGSLGLDEGLAMLTCLAAALDHAHSRGVVHRDVKPGNIVVLADGTPKLMDFGLAQVEGEESDADDRYLGTPSYMAPEQLGKGPTGPASDLFALGVLAYEMLTGHKPFVGDNVGSITYRVAFVAPAPPTSLNPRLSAAHDEALVSMLAKDPSARFPSGAAFVEALEAGRTRLVGAIVGRQGPEPVFRRPNETHDLKLRHEAAVSARAEALSAGPVLEVVTDPTAAAVFLDGVHAGLTPLRLRGIDAGAHTLRLIRDGYVVVQATIALGETSTPRLAFTLQAIPRRRRHRRSPTDAISLADRLNLPPMTVEAALVPVPLPPTRRGN